MTILNNVGKRKICIAKIISVFLLILTSIGFSLQAQQPNLVPYLAQSEQPTPAVIVCPGGSYCWLDKSNEGELVAQWLQREGISAFVLRYPVQGIFSFVSHSRYFNRGHQHPDAVNALFESIRLIRDSATAYNVDPDRVGAMGFSAGGHLVVSAAEFYQTEQERPDFVAAIYPVVTLSQKPWVHKRSRRALLGEYRKFSHHWRDSLSLEHHVHADMPPVFLVNCLDDPTVHYHNSELLDSALSLHHVSHQYLQYQTGGHGFGASEVKGSPECRQWRTRFLEWFHSLL